MSPDTESAPRLRPVAEGDLALMVTVVATPARTRRVLHLVQRNQVAVAVLVAGRTPFLLLDDLAPARASARRAQDHSSGRPERTFATVKPGH